MVMLRDYVRDIRICPKPRCNGVARLGPNNYKFLNTGEPYLLRKCNECGRTWVVFNKEGK